MIKIFFSVIILSILALAQEKPNSNVELPDFVITGRDVISLQQAKKIKPEPVSTVSQDFFKPLFSPDELGIEDISNPISNKLELYDTLNYNGSVDFGLGGFTLPRVNALYSIPFSNGIFNSSFNGGNTLNYVDNSGRSEWNFGANLSYFINNDIPFLGGTKISLHGDYSAAAYKFFGSRTPDSVRHLNTGDFSFGIDNLIDKNFLISAKVLDQYSSLPFDVFSENLLTTSFYSEAKFSALSIGLNLNAINQFLTINRSLGSSKLNNGLNGMFDIRPFAGLNISSLIKVKFGFTYAKVKNDNFFGPYGALGIQLNKDLSLFAEINPHAEFISNGNFLRENNYNIPENTPNIFLKKKFSLNSVLKYEYDQYFEIDAGAECFSADNFPYFTDQINIGKFNVALTNAKSYSVFVNLLFHAGPYGIFYGNASLNSTKDNNGKYIPYYPVAKLSLVYGYNFTEKLNAEARLYFNSSQFADIINSETIKSYFDMGLKLKYQVISQFQLTFEIQNLFNQKNFKWHNYKEIPLNLIGGINIRW